MAKEVDIDIKAKCHELEEKVRDKIVKHPFISVGIGVGLGLILGRLLKCHRD